MRKKLHLIPGTMCNEKLWIALVPLLRDSYDLVYLSIPRYKNFDELAEYYNDVIGSERINLIGFSLGGYIATYFASLYPERIEKLFVISNSPTCLLPTELNQRNTVLEFVKTYGYSGMSRKKIASMLDSTNRTNDLIDVIAEMDRELGEAELISQYQHTSTRLDLAHAITQLPFHTHFYYSADDSMVNTKWLTDLANVSPQLSVISTTGSGHMLPLEKPQELADHIYSWLSL